jgi:signal transduction histidine kinase
MMNSLNPERPAPSGLLARYAAKLKVLLEKDRADRIATSVYEELDRAYRYGQSETVTAVLHNVRNLLNPLVMRLGQAHDSDPRPTPDQVSQALRELVKCSDDVERRSKLAQFVELAFQALADRQLETQSRQLKLLGQARQIENVLNEFNDVSQFTQRPERVTVEEAMRNVETISRGFQDNGIKLLMAAELRRLPPFLARRFQLKQVFINLLTNAREAIAERGIAHGQVEITGQVEMRGDRDFVRFTVRDNGCGISPDHLDLLFQRGFSTKSTAGHGLGLHWCANCVTEMGGLILAESTGEGQGAAFHILLPCWRDRPS